MSSAIKFKFVKVTQFEITVFVLYNNALGNTN